MTEFSRPAITDRILRIRATLPSTVKLIAVTKYVGLAEMRQAYAAGIRDFGESRIQEAEAKQAQLSDWTDVTWHLIGHLQTNKVQKALKLFQWIHSVDSIKLADRLNTLAAPLPAKPKLCLQVKARPDPTKYGWSVPDLWNDLPTLDRFTHVDICGLMAIAPLNLEGPATLQLFQEIRDLADAIQQRSLVHIRMDELSMGMSGDYPLAIQAGATMIRLGSILFDDRP